MYTLEYLPSAVADILEIDAYLYEHSISAASKFADSIERLTETLIKHPLMYPVYEDDIYFRHMIILYGYRIFYHVDEEAKIIKVHRILHGTRDVKSIIEGEQ